MAAVAYGDQEVNNGMIELGRLFDPDIEDYCLQRVLLCRHEVARVSDAIWRLKHGEPIGEELRHEMDQAYAAISANPASVQKSLDRITAALDGQTPD